MQKIRLLRALNDKDIILSQNDNGIVSKILLHEVLKELVLKYEPDQLKELSKSQMQIYILERLKYYIINNKEEFNELIDSKMLEVNKLVSDLARGNYSACNYILFQKHLSSLLSHIRNGSSISTEWISTTTSLSALKKYYDNQPVNKVALIETFYNGFSNDKTFCIDLSSKKSIQRVNKALPKHIDTNLADIFAMLSQYNSGLGVVFEKDYVSNTTTNFPGYNYAVSSKEFCIYNYIPKNEIINVLGKLEMDLIYSGILPVDYLQMTTDKQKMHLQRIKGLLFLKVKKKNLRLQQAYKRLYIKDINDNSLINEKCAILNLAKNIKIDL